MAALLRDLWGPSPFPQPRMQGPQRTLGFLLDYDVLSPGVWNATFFITYSLDILRHFWTFSSVSLTT